VANVTLGSTCLLLLVVIIIAALGKTFMARFILGLTSIKRGSGFFFSPQLQAIHISHQCA